MNKFHNVMEQIVSDKLNEICKTVEMCECEKCRNDVIALTLNQLSPRYVVTREGELYVRFIDLTKEQEFNVVIALTKAIKMVNENPRH